MAKDERYAHRRVADGIYERNGRYVVHVWNPSKGRSGGKDTHTLERGTSLAQAKAFKRKAEEDKRSGKRRSAETVDSWAGSYVRGKWRSGRWLERWPRGAESTNIHNDERIRAFAREFAGRRLDSITEDEAQQFVLDHPSSSKEARAMFNDALKLRLVDRNPFAGVQAAAAKRGRRDIDVLSWAEVQKLAGIARVVHGDYGATFAAMILTAAWTGMRPGELYLLALAAGEEELRNWVDFDAGELHIDWAVNGKTGKITRPKYDSQRVTLLLPEAEKAIRSVPETDGWLFATKRGKRFSQRTFHYYWDPVRAAFTASLPGSHWLPQRVAEFGDDGNLDFYELRHFFGTKLAHPPAGIRPASPYEIAYQMGHKDGGALAMSTYIHKPADDARNGLRDAWAKAS